MKNNIPDQILRVMDRLEQNNMSVSYVETKDQVAAAVEALLQPGDTIGLGGSVTLQECGVLELVRRPDYRLIDRYQPGLTPEQMRERFVQALSADVFLCSSNAVTEQGELYNVDGTANRVAAMTYGPRKVILVVGINKIVPDMSAAVERVRTIAAPLNARRLNRDTYCAVNGKCVACGKPMGDGCTSPQRICRDFVVSTTQAQKGRIHVILVGESVGY